MKPGGSWPKSLALPAILAIGATILVLAGFLLARDLPPFASLEGQSLTWRFRLRGPLPPAQDVAILAVDDRSIAALRGWPLARRHLGEAIEALDKAGARAIAVDLLLLDREQPSDGITLAPGDRILREALLRRPGTVLSMAMTFGDGRASSEDAADAAAKAAYRLVQRPPGLRGEGAPTAQGALAPFLNLREMAALGHVNVLLEDDGALRYVSLAIKLGDYFVRALPVELARQTLDLSEDQMALRLGASLMLGGREIAIDRRSRLPINYLGPPGRVPTYALIDLLQGRLPDGAFKGKAVMIGAAALGVGDTFATPFSGSLAGVEVLATVAQNMISGRVLKNSDEALMLGVLAILALGFGAAGLGRLPSPTIATLAVLALAGLWFASAHLAFVEWRIWINVTFPTAALLINAGLVGAQRSAVERRLRRRIERERRNLSRYHSPLIADLLADDGAKLDERQQDAAILFVDMAGFTGRMESMPTRETAQFLRNFHSRIERAVLAHGGVLEQFTGDGAMVIFGVPESRPGDATAAVACAREIVNEIASFSAELTAAGKAPLQVGIGIHFGPVVIAKLGGKEQHHLTAAGDTVNVASRLEALTRILGASIVVSASVADAVRNSGDGRLLAGFERLPSQPIRGRSGRLDVWALRLDR